MKVKSFIIFSLFILPLQSNAFEFKGEDNALPSEDAFKVFVEKNEDGVTVIFDTEKIIISIRIK